MIDVNSGIIKWKSEQILSTRYIQCINNIEHFRAKIAHSYSVVQTGQDEKHM